MNEDIYNAFNYDSYLLAEKIGFPAVYRHKPERPIHKKIPNTFEVTNSDAGYTKEILRKQIQDELEKTYGNIGKNNIECCSSCRTSNIKECSSCRKNKENICEVVRTPNVTSIPPNEKPIHKLFDEKTLLIFIFILVVFCVVQYMNQQQTNRLMEDLLKSISKPAVEKPEVK